MRSDATPRRHIDVDFITKNAFRTPRNVVVRKGRSVWVISLKSFGFLLCGTAVPAAWGSMSRCAESSVVTSDASHEQLDVVVLRQRRVIVSLNTFESRPVRMGFPPWRLITRVRRFIRAIFWCCREARVTVCLFQHQCPVTRRGRPGGPKHVRYYRKGINHMPRNASIILENIGKLLL